MLNVVFSIRVRSVINPFFKRRLRTVLKDQRHPFCLIEKTTVVDADYLEQLAGGARRSQQWAQFEERCLLSSGKLNCWHFDRDVANER